MTKPQSYPFLAIAKRYGLDYGDVLLYADIARKPYIDLTYWHCAAIDTISAIEPDYATCNDILSAGDEFLRIQTGEIDWQTGEPVKELYRDYLKLDSIRFAGTLQDNLVQGRDQFPSFECKHEWMPHGDGHESHCVNCGLIKP
jgi:hypothetical protein